MPTANESVNGEVGAGCNVENTIPVLTVSDMQVSIRFYRNVLGFKLDWGGETDSSHIASVSRDGHAIMLQRRQPVAWGCVWIGGSILVSVWDKIRLRADVTVVQRPTNQPWALDMKIKDPDANILWFGADPLEDVPFGNEPADSQLPR
ncbi:MAG: VOC family protein [Tepidisphaeraceae bacterium]|jgi:catechol 2,3-dioxygenase-like lactoylglutathione lyase family enzyme